MDKKPDKPTRFDHHHFYDEYFSTYYSQCADSSWDERDPQNIEEGFAQWLCDEGIIRWDKSDWDNA